MPELTQDTLQMFATRRGGMKWRGKTISAATIKKEIVSLRTAWNWGTGAGIVSGRFPSLRNIRMAKPEEKPPFQTWQEIERRIALGGLTEDQVAELWDALYLRKEEIVGLLRHVKEHATLPWVYPLICTTAHTGARRSELLRMLVGDIDFSGDNLLVREKKRALNKNTTRRVSLTPFLKQTLQDWLAVHPGGQYLFCQSHLVPRSKKRSRTTGHKGEKTRASSLKGRKARHRLLPLTCMLIALEVQGQPSL